MSVNTASMAAVMLNVQFNEHFLSLQIGFCVLRIDQALKPALQVSVSLGMCI